MGVGAFELKPKGPNAKSGSTILRDISFNSTRPILSLPSLPFPIAILTAWIRSAILCEGNLSFCSLCYHCYFQVGYLCAFCKVPWGERNDSFIGASCWRWGIPSFIQLLLPSKTVTQCSIRYSDATFGFV